MAWRRLLVPAWSGVLILVAGGCASPGGAVLPVSRDTLPTGAAAAPEPGVARWQPPGGEPPPPAGTQVAAAQLPQPGLPTPGGVTTAGQPGSGRDKVSVRAWVNGRPIFDDEVMDRVARRRGE